MVKNIDKGLNLIEVEKWVCPECGKEMAGRFKKVVVDSKENYVFEKYCKCGYTK